MEKLTGVVERITYANEEKGYSVIKIKTQGYNDLITLVGNMASVSVGAVVAAAGVWTHNAKFGRQFNVNSWEESVPATVFGIEKYLGSGSSVLNLRKLLLRSLGKRGGYKKH